MRTFTSTRLKAFFAVMSVGAVLSASGQIQLGIKGGLNISELLTSKTQNVYVSGNEQSVRNFPTNGLDAGLLVSIPLKKKKFSLQPELVYSQQGATAKPSYGYLVSSSEKYKLNYINVPVLFKYNMPTGVFIETGPQLGVLMSAGIDETIVGADHTVKYHVKDQFKSIDAAWVLGAGYLSPIDFGIDIRYNRGLTNIANSSASGMQRAPVQNGTARNSVVQIGIFYLFGKSGLQPEHKDE